MLFTANDCSHHLRLGIPELLLLVQGVFNLYSVRSATPTRLRNLDAKPGVTCLLWTSLLALTGQGMGKEES